MTASGNTGLSVRRDTPTAEAPRKRTKSGGGGRLLKWLLSPSALATVILFFWVGVWWFITAFHLVNTQFVTPPGEILHEFVLLFQSGYTGTPFTVHIFASLKRTLIGYSLGVLVAVPFGLLIGLNPWVKAIFGPLFSLLRPIPAIAFLPLFILWFGIGETARVSLIFLSAFLYILLSTSNGVRSVPQNLILAARNLGASRWQIFFRVVLPASMPSIMTGMKTGLAVSWAIVVAAELIAAQRGLGYMIMDAATFYRIPDVYVGVISIGIIGLLMERIITFVEHRLTHWTGKS